jgi:hypothetical protein
MKALHPLWERWCSTTERFYSALWRCQIAFACLPFLILCHELDAARISQLANRGGCRLPVPYIELFSFRPLLEGIHLSSRPVARYGFALPPRSSQRFFEYKHRHADHPQDAPFCRCFSTDRKGQKEMISAEKIQDIRGMYRNGEPIAWIAKRVGVSKLTASSRRRPCLGKLKLEYQASCELWCSIMRRCDVARAGDPCVEVCDGQQQAQRERRPPA